MEENNININYESLQLFLKGMHWNRHENAEDPETFQDGKNFRLRSKNGKLCASSIEGTIEIYNNPYVVKYLGYAVFKDSMVCLVKLQKELILDRAIEQRTTLNGDPISLTIPYLSNTFNVVSELTDNSSESVTNKMKYVFDEIEPEPTSRYSVEEGEQID